MPRKPRFFPGVPAHLVQRGNNRQAVFYNEADYRAYLEWLVEGGKRYSCAIHAYVLMTNKDFETTFCSWIGQAENVERACERNRQRWARGIRASRRLFPS